MIPIVTMKHVKPLVFSGRCGDLVFCITENGSYARVYTKPSNPNTVPQQQQRGRFGAAVDAWKALPEDQKVEYRKRGKRAGRKGYHLFMSEFFARLQK
jgi:hypothetical protein